MSSTDKDWEHIAQTEPYFGVLTNQQFLAANLDQNAEQRFWASGERHIDAVFSNIKKHIKAGFIPETALDFGCGMGRLLKPMSLRCDKVTGLDVSVTMLELALKNLTEEEQQKTSLVSGLEDLGNETFDFIHSFIVFQHIPQRRGYMILDQLLKRLNDGGVGVLHFSFDNYSSHSWLRTARRLPLSKQVGNLLQRKPINEPAMQMNEYDMNRILTCLHSNGCKSMYVDFTDHGVRGAVLYFEKNQALAK